MVEQIITCCLPEGPARDRAIEQAAAPWAVLNKQRPPGYIGPLPDGVEDSNPLASVVRSQRARIKNLEKLLDSSHDDLVRSLLLMATTKNTFDTVLTAVRVDRDKAVKALREARAQTVVHIIGEDQLKEKLTQASGESPACQPEGWLKAERDGLVEGWH